MVDKGTYETFSDPQTVELSKIVANDNGLTLEYGEATIVAACSWFDGVGIVRESSKLRRTRLLHDSHA